MIVAERRGAFAVLAGALLIAGCHAAGPENAVTPTPHPTAAPSPAARPGPDAALGRYIGHYPFDTVDGVRFLDQPKVTSAVAALVPDAKVRALVLGGDGPGTPVALKGDKLIAWGCETHNCGGHDWAISIAPDGGGASVCYHDQAVMRDRARWYLAPGRSEMRAGDCPSE